MLHREPENLLSQVYWTGDKRFAFQRVGRYYRVYDHDGEFVKEFTGFEKMCEWISEQDVITEMMYEPVANPVEPL